MKYINRVGLEIEGGWFKPFTSPCLKGDGSVGFKKTVFQDRNNKKRELLVGECASQPMSCIEDISNWIDRHWPNKRNKSCGFHIHVSFKDANHYNILMTEKFYNEFLLAAEKFAHENRMSKDFFNRLKGKNTFCARLFNAHRQVNATSKLSDRYTHLNYCRALRGTIENRLPCGTMPRGKGLKTVEWFINLIENYLDNNLPKPVTTITIPVVAAPITAAAQF